MCDGTTLMLRPDHVHFVAVDPYVENAHAVWGNSDFTAARTPPRTGPVTGSIATFAEFAPMTYMLRRFDGDPFADKVRARQPILSTAIDD